MLDISPNSLVYRDVRLNNAYVNSVCITNPLPATVEFTLRASSQRYSLTPNRVTLSAGQSIVVTVRLFLSHYPNFLKGSKGQDDHIQIKSNYFEQQIPLTFFLHSRDTPTSAVRARSLSPMIRKGNDSEGGSEDGSIDKSTNASTIINTSINRSRSTSRGRNNSTSSHGNDDLIETLQGVIRSKDEKIQRLNDTVGHLEARYPNWQQIIQNRIDQERIVFEEKSEKVLRILKKKDDTIASLQKQLDNISKECADLVDANKSLATAAADARKKSGWFDGTDNTLDADTIQSLQIQLEQEIDAHKDTKFRLDEATRKSHTSLLRGNNSNDSHSSMYTPKANRELIGLREKVVDQAEQIEVLLSEVCTLRDAKVGAETSTEAYREIERLNKEINSFQEKYNHLQIKASEFEQQCKRYQEQDERLGTAGREEIHMYKEKVGKSEDIISELKSRLQEAHEREKVATEKYKEMDKRLGDADRHIRLLSEKLDRSVTEKEEFEAKLISQSADLSSAMAKLEVKEDTTSINDGHVWWSYVWHELRKRNSQKSWTKYGDDDTSEENTYDQDTEGTVNRLRELLRQQSVEIATLRQNALGTQLSSKKEMDILNNELDLSKRECARLQCQLRTGKSDRDIRITEMTSTIRVLSARSDIHAQLVQAKQEAESEKLLGNHLRQDLDAYRDMLETEQRNNTQLRRQVEVFQGQVDGMAVMKSLMDVPGVPPLVLIELFSGKLMTSLQDAAKAKAEVSQLSHRLRSESSNRQNMAASGRSQPGSVSSRVAFSPEKPRIFDGAVTGATDRNTGMDASNTPIQVIVDGTNSPNEVLDSLDGVVLSHRILEQDGTIQDLRNRIAELENTMLTSEQGRLSEMDDLEERSKAEIGRNMKRLELLSISLSASKTEIAELRSKNLELEKKLLENTIAASANTWLTSGAKSTSSSRKETTEEPNLIDLATGVNMNEGYIEGEEDYNHEGLEEMRNIIREKKSQLKVMSDTVESLQLGIAPEKGKTGQHALIKRVVELTAELSSQTASTAVAERKVIELEADRVKKAKLCCTLKAQVRDNEQMIDDLKTQYKTVASELIETEKVRRDERMDLKLEMEEMSRSLKESEAAVQSLEINIDELKTHAKLTEQVDFQKWLESVILNDEKGFVDSMKHPAESVSDDASDNKENEIPNLQSSSSSSTSAVGDLVMELLDQWRHEHPHKVVHINSYNNGLVNEGNILSKGEQKFFQRISDLVADANERCSRTANRLRQAEMHRAKTDMAHAITSNRLKTCIKHLHVYRKRAQASEAVTNNDFKHGLRTQGKLNAILHKALDEVRNKLYDTTDQLLEERRERKLVDLNGVNSVRKVKFYAARIAELETKGPFMLRAKEEALANLDSRIKYTEEACKKWFRSELPQLINGPLVTGMSNIDGNEAVDPQRVLLTSEYGNEDPTFALAQALCASKSVQTAQEVKITSLEESNFVLKEKIITLQGVLHKWQDEVKQLVKDENDDNLENDDLLDSMKNIVYSQSSNETRLTEQVKSLSEIVVSLESEVVEMKSRCDYATDRSDELKRLLDSVMDEEQLLKSKATTQLTRLRIELENNHVNELKELRESYEHEKLTLQEEISRLSLAFDEVNQAASAVTSGETISTPFYLKKLTQSGDDDMLQHKIDSLQRELSHERSKLDEMDEKNKSLEEALRVHKAMIDENSSIIHQHHSHANVHPSVHHQSVVAHSTVMHQAVGGVISTDHIHQAHHDHTVQSVHHSTSTDASGHTSSPQHTKRHLSSHSGASPSHPIHSRSPSHHHSSSSSVHPSDKSSEHSTSTHETHTTHQGRVKRQSVNQQPSPHSSQSPVAADHVSNLSEPTLPPLKLPSTASQEIVVSNTNLTAIENEVLHEDTQLWPNLNTQVQELAEQLQLVSSHIHTGMNDVNLRAAMTSVVRIKASLTQDVVATGSTVGSNTVPFGGGQLKAYEDRHSKSSTLGSIPISPSGSVDELAGLADKASRLEAELRDFHLPERHVSMLKDLNTKAEELKMAMETDMEKDRLEWLKEKSFLEKELIESKGQLDQLVTNHSQSMETLKNRYEQTLQETQEAMEEQTNAARAHISKLDDVIQQTHLQNNELKNRLQELETQKFNLEQNRSKELIEAQKSIQTLTNVNENMQNSLRKMQLEHAKELSNLNESVAQKEHIQNGIIYDLELKFKEAQSKLSQVLQQHEQEKHELHSQLLEAQRLAKNSGVDEKLAFHDMEEKFRNMEYQYKTKCKELEIVLNNINVNEGGKATSMVSTTSMEHRNAPSAPMTAETAELREGIAVLGSILDRKKETSATVHENKEVDEMITRLNGAESELIVLNDNLNAERKLSSSLREQLKELQHQALYSSGKSSDDVGSEVSNTTGDNEIGRTVQDWDVVEKLDFNLIISRWLIRSGLHSPVSNAKEREEQQMLMRPVVGKVLDMKRAASVEMSRLKKNLKESQNNFKQESSKLKNSLAEQKDVVERLREELNRKSKLVSSLKSARDSGDNSTEHWQNEAKELDVKCKRLQQVVKTKDSMIKELKSKIESDAESVASNKQLAQDSSVKGPIIADLKYRLKQSELDKGRLKKSLKDVTDRCENLEKEYPKLKEQASKMVKVSEKNESYKMALLRKEKENRVLTEEINTIKEQAVTDASQLKKEKKELEKDIRHLQRNISLVQEQKDILEQELDVIRVNRVTAIDLSNSYAPVQRMEGVPDSSIPNKPMNYFERTLTASSPANNRTSSPPLSSSSSAAGLAPLPPGTLPSALDESVQDLNDVLIALGDRSPKLDASNLFYPKAAEDLRKSLLGVGGDGGSDWQSSSEESPPETGDDNRSASTERRLKALVTAALTSPEPSKK